MAKTLVKVDADILVVRETDAAGKVKARAFTKDELLKIKADIAARASSDTTEVQAMIDALA
jgi:hypothetical protein